MMFGISATVEQAGLARLENLLRRVAKESPQRLATETRRAALYICKSLKARTKKAPKKIRPRERAAYPSVVPPKYIHSNSTGRPLLRRWTLVRKKGTPDVYAKHYYVYTKAHRGKNGRMVGKDNAAEKRELIEQHGGIMRHGLAKKSWGWVAKGIYSASNMGDLSWKRTKGERRDPRQYVKGEHNATPKGAFARIFNSLDYIRAAMKPGAELEAVNAAAKSLEHNIRNYIERITR